MEYDEVDIIMSDMKSVTKEVQAMVPIPNQSQQGTDEVEVKSMEIISNEKGNKPGHIHPSTTTEDVYYDISHPKQGIALIFNQGKFKDEKKLDRAGTDKDAADLKDVLEGYQFDVEVFKDLEANEIRNILYKVSLEDHSNNDCLWVTVMSHGTKNGKIAAANEDYFVEELWQNFVGNRCESLVGKPKLFFIQACRGIMVDPGVILKLKQAPLEIVVPKSGDEMDSQSTDPVFVIPKLADFLVMYSSAEGHYSFRNPTDGSWFIQALCEELKAKSTKDLFTILTAVTRRVAFEKEAKLAKYKRQIIKQVPCLVSMLTKKMIFTPKKM